MKKYTNKILLITAIVVASLVVLGITIPFQIYYHNHPATPRQHSVSYRLFDMPENEDDMDTLESVTEFETVDTNF